MPSISNQDKIDIDNELSKLKKLAYKALRGKGNTTGGASPELAVRIGCLESHPIAGKEFRKVWKKLKMQEYSWNTYPQKTKRRYLRIMDLFETVPTIKAEHALDLID